MKTTPEQLKRLANEQHVEITRLREENARLREENDAWRMDGGSCAEEVERLHKENARLRVVIKMADWMLEELEAVEGINTLLQAEIARMRTVIKVKLYD